MKKSQLKRLIKEELQKMLLNEAELLTPALMRQEGVPIGFLVQSGGGKFGIKINKSPTPMTMGEAGESGKDVIQKMVVNEAPVIAEIIRKTLLKLRLNDATRSALGG